MNDNTHRIAAGSTAPAPPTPQPTEELISEFVNDYLRGGWSPSNKADAADWLTRFLYRAMGAFCHQEPTADDIAWAQKVAAEESAVAPAPEGVPAPTLESDLLHRLIVYRADIYKHDVIVSLNAVELDILIERLRAQAPAVSPDRFWTHVEMREFIDEAEKHLSGGRTHSAAMMFHRAFEAAPAVSTLLEKLDDLRDDMLSKVISGERGNDKDRWLKKLESVRAAVGAAPEKK